MGRRKANPDNLGATEAPELSTAAKSNKQEDEAIPAHHLENPSKVSGELLRKLAHRHGIAKSDLATMSDEKIRDQMRYLAYRRFEEDESI